MSIHEPARAEAEKRWQRPVSQRAFTDGFLAGHEAATRTRVVTTVAELDALPVGSVVLDSGGGWTWTHVDDTERLDEEGDRLRRAWACVAYRSDRTAAEMFHGGGRSIGVGVGPFRVLYDPEETR